MSCRDVSVEVGKGLSGTVGLNKEAVFVSAGSRLYMKEEVPQVSFPGASEIFVSFAEKGLFVCYLKDTLRQESRPAIQALQKLKKRVVLISGDKDVNVQSIAAELGILDVVSEASPEDKVTRVSSLLKDGLVMVGDGLNDAPALAEATVGISMGTLSSASAREASDVILLRDNLLLIPLLFQKSRTTRRVIRQNLFLSLSALLAGTILALGGAITLWCAVLLHEGSTLLVGLNGLRLLRSKSTN